LPSVNPRQAKSARDPDAAVAAGDSVPTIATRGQANAVAVARQEVGVNFASASRREDGRRLATCGRSGSVLDDLLPWECQHCHPRRIRAVSESPRRGRRSSGPGVKEMERHEASQRSNALRASRHARGFYPTPELDRLYAVDNGRYGSGGPAGIRIQAPDIVDSAPHMRKVPQFRRVAGQPTTE
jgi:hypothetical protein